MMVSSESEDGSTSLELEIIQCKMDSPKEDVFHDMISSKK